MDQHIKKKGGRPRKGAIAPPMGGADWELGNFIQGGPYLRDTCTPAARAILAEVEGFPLGEPAVVAWSPATGSYGGNGASAGGWGSSPAFNAQDSCRKFLADNGGCIYIDLGHTEVCLPEITSARAFVAYWHAMLRIVRRAQEKANRKLPPGQRIQVLVNNSDGRGNSYGAHLNFLVGRRMFDNLFSRKVHHMLFLAAYQVSSIVFTGQGKVGSENGRDPVSYQLSQRADFYETLSGIQTTYRRPLVNLRDEPLCGQCGRSQAPHDRWARLHVIFYDANLAHAACYLKFGVLQIILAMIAAERVNPRLILDDPVAAVVAWSHDISLGRRMAMLYGARLTAVELQLLFLEEARRFVDGGQCNVPDAAGILDLWQDTLVKLRAGDLADLAPRLDWVLKLSTLRQALDERPDLKWSSPEIKYLDHLYGSLDPREGLYWSYEQQEVVERIAGEPEIERAMTQPPDDSRAYARAMLLRMADPATVTRVDWDSIDFSLRAPDGWTRPRTIQMADPVGMTRSRTQRVFARADSLPDTLDNLGAR